MWAEVLKKTLADGRARRVRRARRARLKPASGKGHGVGKGRRTSNMAAPAPSSDMAAAPTVDVDAMTEDELREALTELGLRPHHRSGRAKLAADLLEALAHGDGG